MRKVYVQEMHCVIQVKRAVDGMLNVGNQKQLRETINEMSMIENIKNSKMTRRIAAFFRRTL